MDSAELSLTLQQNDHRRGRMLLCLALAAIAAIGFYAGMAKLVEARSITAETARLTADALRLQANIQAVEKNDLARLRDALTQERERSKSSLVKMIKSLDGDIAAARGRLSALQQRQRDGEAGLSTESEEEWVKALERQRETLLVGVD